MNAKRTSTYKRDLGRDVRRARMAQFRRQYARIPRYIRPNADSNGALTVKIKVEPTHDSYINASSSVDAGYAWSFSLRDLPDVSSYKAIYDQYRINWIKAILTPVSNAQIVGSPQFAPLATCVDYDDVNIPTSYYAILQYGNSLVNVVNPTSQPVIRAFVPAIGTIVQDSVSQVAAGVKKKQWLDIASDEIPHYGLKACFKTCTSTNVPYYYVYFIYSVSFKCVR